MAGGNTLSADNTKYTYNSRGRLAAVESRSRDGFGNASYLYNALGERVQKDLGGRHTRRNDRDHDRDCDRDDNRNRKAFIYDSQGHLIAETGRGDKEYIYLGDLPIAVADGRDVYYIHADHLAQPQKMTDERQKIVWDRIADPFGDTVDIQGPVTLNLRFPGQYHDTETGLDYNYFRSYNPETGRYTQSDPIGLAGGVNT